MKEAEIEVPLVVSPARLSPTTLGTTALAAGLVALTAVLAGASSWMILGAALAVWSVCGWAIYFRPHTPDRITAVLGAVLLLSAATATLVVLSGLYLLALGPSWIL